MFSLFRSYLLFLLKYPHLLNLSTGTLGGVAQCTVKSDTYHSGECSVAERVQAPLYSKSCVAGGTNNEEAQTCEIFEKKPIDKRGSSKNPHVVEYRYYCVSSRLCMLKGLLETDQL